MITPEFLHGWAQRLAHFTGTTCAEAAAWLGVDVAKPPAGAASVQFEAEPGGGDTFFYVELKLAAPGLTLAQLEAVLGPGKKLPRTGPSADYVQVFFLDFAGAPSLASVTASFRANPASGAASMRVTVRRNTR